MTSFAAKTAARQSPAKRAAPAAARTVERIGAPLQGAGAEVAVDAVLDASAGSRRADFSAVPLSAAQALPGAPAEPTESRRAAVDALVLRFAQDMGRPAREFVVHQDDAARARTRMHGVRGLVDGGVAYLDPDRFDPASADGATLVGHELTHIAQSHALGVARGGSEQEAEEEARQVGADFAAGRRLAPPSIAWRARAFDSPKIGHATQSLPDKQDVGFLPSGVIVLRTSWWIEGMSVERVGGKAKTVKMMNPAKVRELLRLMRRARYYWWMTDANIEYIADNFALKGTELDPDETFFTMAWGSDILKVVGPPPGASFYFQRSGEDIRGFMRSSELHPGTVTEKVTVPLPRADRIRMLDALDKFTGLTSTEDSRRKYIGLDELVLDTDYSATSFLIGKSTLDLFYGTSQYKQYLAGKKPNLDTQAPVRTLTTGGGMVLRFDVDISDADMTYAAAWLEALRTNPAGGTGGPQVGGLIYTPYYIRLMRQIDAHPQKAAILAALRGYGVVHASDMMLAIAAAEYAAAAKEVGLGPAPVRQRAFDEPVAGEIMVEGLAYPGRQIRMWFKKSNTAQIFRFETVRTQWLVQKKKADNTWDQPADSPEETVEFNAVEPTYFKYTFDDIGFYRVHAFVDDTWYFPAHFTEEVEVRTEAARLKGIKDTAFAGMGDPAVTDANKSFDTTLFNEVFGKERYHVGTQLGADLPADWQRMSDTDRLAFIVNDKKNLNALIAQYDKPDAPYRQKSLVDYAKDRLKSLEAQEDKIGEEKSAGYVHFEARGAYLSRTKGVPDSPLKLLGLAKGAPEKMSLVVHDFTRLTETVDSKFEADGGGFSDAAEAVFLKICKHYPAGKMSVLFEVVNNANVPQKKTIGFELDTNTAYKSVRSVVWDPAVQIAVNLAGAALIIFFPPTAAIVLPILGVYNSIEVVNKMSDLKDSGNLTWGAFGKGVAEIGLNVLPVIGEFKALSIAAKTASVGAKAVTVADRVVLYGLTGVTVGGMAVLMTVEGVQQCTELQEQDVSEVAAILAELNEARAQNPNSPKVTELEAKLKKASDRALKRAQDTFEGMAKSLAIILVPTAAMTRISGAIAAKSVGALIEEGRFVHEPGVAPHYDPVDGVMRGDKAKVTPQVLDGLKASYAADQGIKQVQLEKMAGSDKVQLKTSATAKKVSVSVDPGTGMTTIEAPQGMPFEQVVKDAWDQHFSKQVGAPADMPVIAGSGAPATTSAKVIATTANVRVGRGVKELSEAKSLLRRLADGDATVFGELGAETPPKGFDIQSVEWGLGTTADGQNVIVRGDATHVDWSKTPGVKPVAHTHPMSQSKKLSGWKVTFADLVKGAGENAANADKVLASPADIKYMVDNGLAVHTIETPYVDKGNGVIGNPTRGLDEPKIQIEISQPEQAGLWHNLSDVPVYKARMRASSGGKAPLWEADVWVTHSPEAGSQLMFQEPAPDVMTKPRAGTPGRAAGGGAMFSGAHDFTPTTAAQTRALNDWNKLQASPTRYGGKFSWEDWLFRYENEGLVYDVEGTRKWKTPEGMVREVELFDAGASAADVVKRLTTEGAGKGGATSTFKSFFETLVRRKLLKDGAELQAYIEKNVSFKERSVDFVRHKLKAEFKPQLMEQASPKRWSAARLAEMQTAHPDLPWAAEPAKAREAAGHREMSDVVKDLDSSDKGPMFEQWVQENVFPDATSQLAATKSEIDPQLKPGETLGDNRKIDLRQGETGIEVKTVNDRLPLEERSLDASRRPTSQLLDNLRMVASEVKLAVKGQVVQLKKLKYVFTTTKGAVANLDTIKEVLGNPRFEGKITFDVFDAKGTRHTISSLDDLGTPQLAWLK